MGGWSGRAVAQQRPRVSKPGLKGLSDHHFIEIAVEAARRGAGGLNNRATLMEYLLKRERWTTALSLTKQGQKAACQIKIPLVRKSYSLYLFGESCRRELMKSVKTMMSENQSSQSQVHVTEFRGTEG